MMEIDKVEFLQVLWVLNRHQIRSSEGLVCKQILPVFGFYIQLFYRLYYLFNIKIIKK